MHFEFDYELTSDPAGTRATARITDGGLELINALGTSQIPWETIDHVEPGPEVWVFYLPSHRITLPSWALIGDSGKFVLAKLGQSP